MAEQETQAFRVNGKAYRMPTDLTLGEMCDAERFFGVEFGNSATSGIRMIAAMLWIAVSRADPTVTIDDIRSLPPEVFASLGEDDDVVPPESVAEETGLSVTSGDGSSNGSADPATIPEPIGSPL